MKKICFKTAALCLAVLFAAVFALPGFASGHDAEPCYSELTYEKLTAFWHQPAYNGLNNGEAVYDHEWRPNGGYFTDVNELYYHDSWDTMLVQYYGSAFWLVFFYDVEYSFGENGEYVYGSEYVYPDLYGELDLAGTDLYGVSSPRANQTHITSLDASGCSRLGGLCFSGQKYCTSIDASGSPVELFEALDNNCRYLAFAPPALDKEVTVEALGFGTVGAYYYARQGDGVTVHAYPEKDNFVGWYLDGELVSTELDYTFSGGGDIKANFGGDVDFDGQITALDALMVLRQALGIVHLELPTAAMDVTGNGLVDANDALTIMRLALGIA